MCKIPEREPPKICTVSGCAEPAVYEWSGFVGHLRLCARHFDKAFARASFSFVRHQNWPPRAL